MTLKSSNLLSILAAFVGFCGAAPAIAQQYDIVDIGLVQPGDSVSQGFGVSLGGVGVGRSVGNPTQAFSWTVGGGIVGLGLLPGRSLSVAHGANDTGLVVGTASTTLFGSSPLPVLWTNGVVSQLPLLAGESLGRANDINASGAVVGSMNSGGREFGVIWEGGAPSPITATTPGGSSMRTAFRLNDAGIVAGFGVDPNNLARNVGLMYDSVANTMTEVPPLPRHNGALAWDVSEAGHVVGSSSFNQSGSVPFIWDSVNGSVRIPLPAGTSTAFARGVNSSGFVVGIGSGQFAVPFLYDGVMTHRLQDLIDPLSGWDLSTNTSSSALGISEEGTIIGTGVFNGDLHAYAMIPVSGNGCYADCDPSTGAGVLDLFDFLCFQNSFVSGESYACDCDTTTGLLVCDLFDFLCFQSAFVGGCP